MYESEAGIVHRVRERETEKQRQDERLWENQRERENRREKLKESF